MKVSDIMTRRVISVTPDDTIFHAARLMLRHHISGLPVIDSSGRLVGIVSEADFLRRAETATTRRRARWLEFFIGAGKMASEYTHSHGKKVGEVMTREIVSVRPSADLETVVDLMEHRRIKRIPVVSRGRVLGIVTRSTLLHALLGAARTVRSTTQSDMIIRERFLAEMSKQPWAPTSTIDVVVRDGVIELWGTIDDERQRAALRVAAENISAVKEVKDHLVWAAMMIQSDKEDAPLP